MKRDSINCRKLLWLMQEIKLIFLFQSGQLHRSTILEYILFTVLNKPLNRSATFRSGRFGQAVSITGHFCQVVSGDISVVKCLYKNNWLYDATAFQTTETWIELSRMLHMLRFSLCGKGKHVISFVLPVISARLACGLKSHYAELTKHIMSHKVARCSRHERTVLFCCHWPSWTPHVVVAIILVFMNNLFETKEHWTTQTCFPLTHVRIGSTQQK